MHSVVAERLANYLGCAKHLGLHIWFYYDYVLHWQPGWWGFLRVTHTGTRSIESE